MVNIAILVCRGLHDLLRRVKLDVSARGVIQNEVVH